MNIDRGVSLNASLAYLATLPPPITNDDDDDDDDDVENADQTNNRQNHQQ